MPKAKKKTKWSKVLRTRGPSNVIVEIGVGEGHRGVGHFVWERPEWVEEWEDDIPENRALEMDMGAGDEVPFSTLESVILVKVFNPSTKRTSVDCKVYQKDHPELGHEAELFATADSNHSIIPYIIRLTFARG